MSKRKPDQKLSSFSLIKDNEAVGPVKLNLSAVHTVHKEALFGKICRLHQLP